jgi:hypothetical protein
MLAFAAYGACERNWLGSGGDARCDAVPMACSVPKPHADKPRRRGDSTTELPEEIFSQATRTAKTSPDQ